MNSYFLAPVGRVSPVVTQSEELLIESNILLKDTDMDIRMGRPVNPCCVWDWRTHFIMDKVAPDIQDLDHIFKLKTDAKNWKERLLEHFFIKNARCARDHYMEEIYANRTVNISHLASTLIMSLIGTKRRLLKNAGFTPYSMWRLKICKKTRISICTAAC